jgi:hypothetical protein
MRSLLAIVLSFAMTGLFILRTNLLRATLVAAALFAAIPGPARAQVDPQEHAQLIALTTRMVSLEARMQKQEIESAVLRADMQKEFAKDRLEMQGLHSDVFTLNTTMGGLLRELNALKARQPAEPGKQPARDDPAKPADGQVLSLRAPFVVKDGGGRVIFKVEVAAGNMPRAVVGNPTGGRVELGIGVGGASVVGLYDDSNKVLSTLVADPKGSYLRVKDNDQSAGLGKIEGSGLGLFMLKGDKSFGEVSADSKGFGIFKVFGTDGKAVGGLYAGTEGGGLALTAPGGGKSVVSLAVTPTGGKVRVFAAAGGKARAELIANDAIGAINIFDSEGGTAVTVAAVESKAGKIEISNGRGDIVVQAGAQKSGRGMVTTGPFEGGLAGTLGAALSPASTIVGQMKSK